MYRIVAITATIAFLAVAADVAAQDRLKITVVPVVVVTTDTHVQAKPDWIPPKHPHTMAMAALHEALLLLEVDSFHVEVSSTKTAEFLSRVRADYVTPTICTHGSQSMLSEEQFKTLPATLGYSAGGPGEIVLLVLVKPQNFPWQGKYWGSATVTTWDSTGSSADVASMHWSTTACSAWAHLHIPTIAHEIGHCFGLLHNGTLDTNNSSLAGIIPDFVSGYDLMAESCSPLYSGTLNPSNQARVQLHFRELESIAPDTSLRSVTRSFQLQ